MSTIDPEFEKKLQASGLRLTKPRLKILEALSQHNRPVGAYQLRDLITSQGNDVNIVSIYRNIAAFQELGIVHYIPSQNGYLLCSANCHDDLQTEHLVCNSCGDVTEIPLPDCATNDLREQANLKGFALSRIRVEVEGTCASCQTK